MTVTSSCAAEAETPPVPESLSALGTELGLNLFLEDAPSPAGETTFLLTALATFSIEAAGSLRGILLPTGGVTARGTGAFPLALAEVAAVADLVPRLSPLAIVQETTVRARAVL